MANQVSNILADPKFQNSGMNKVTVFAPEGGDLTSDVYYFKAGQVLGYHRHPNGDQVFVICSGAGKFYLDDGTESVIDVTAGSMVYVPTGVWHQLINGDGGDMVAVQVTKAGAGMEAR